MNNKNNFMSKRNETELVRSSFLTYFNIRDVFVHCSSTDIVECIRKNYIKDLVYLLLILDSFRSYIETPIRITSGFRNKERNDLLPNSSSTSQHLIGQAIDFQPVDYPFATFVTLFLDYIKNSFYNEDIGQVIIYQSFIHISLRNNQIKKFTIYDKRNC